MKERKREGDDQFDVERDVEADVNLDPTELSRLAAAFMRQQAQASATPMRAPGSIKRNLPYIALALAAMLAAFATYQSSIAPQPIVIAPESSAVPQTASHPDKGQQISSCQTESLRLYPQQGDVNALQFYNLCMTGAGFVPNYNCDTSVGIPSYNPECWMAGKNM